MLFKTVQSMESPEIEGCVLTDLGAGQDREQGPWGVHRVAWPREPGAEGGGGGWIWMPD